MFPEKRRADKAIWIVTDDTERLTDIMYKDNENNIKAMEVMEWKKFVLTTTTQAVDLVSTVLMENGIDSFEIEDKQQISEEDKAAMYIDILPQLEDDGTARLIFYMDIDTDKEEEQSILDNIMQGIEELKNFVEVGDVRITDTTTNELEWINKWKEYFKPFTVDDILIRPTWEQVEHEAEYKMVIKIDPGTAFGTGLHETTQLCIRQLRKYISHDTRLLDVGCGSGILSIIGKKLGAEYVLGIDIDNRAVVASKENAIENEVTYSNPKENNSKENKPKENNPKESEVKGHINKTGTDAGIEFMEGNIIEDKAVRDKAGYECYDVVVANILADVIIPLSRVIAPHLKKNGLFITSGIIENKEPEVVAAIEANEEWKIKEITRQKDWVSITAQKI